MTTPIEGPFPKAKYMVVADIDSEGRAASNLQDLPSYNVGEFVWAMSKAGIDGVYCDPTAKGILDTGTATAIANELNSGKPLIGVLENNLKTTMLEVACLKKDNGKYYLYIVGTKANIDFLIRKGYAIINAVNPPVKTLSYIVRIGERDEMKELESGKGAFISAKAFVEAVINNIPKDTINELKDDIGELNKTVETAFYDEFKAMAESLGNFPLLIEMLRETRQVGDINVANGQLIRAALRAHLEYPEIRMVFPVLSSRMSFDLTKREVQSGKMNLIARLAADSNPASVGKDLDSVTKIVTDIVKIGVLLEDPKISFSYEGLKDNIDFAVIHVPDKYSMDDAFNVAATITDLNKDAFLWLGAAAAQFFDPIQLTNWKIRSVIARRETLDGLEGQVQPVV